MDDEEDDDEEEETIQNFKPFISSAQDGMNNHSKMRSKALAIDYFLQVSAGIHNLYCPLSCYGELACLANRK